MENTNNRIAWLSKPVQSFLVTEAKSKDSLETGGILMGYFASENVPVILHATGPGPNAIHHHNYYLPDQKFDEAVIATVYEKSDREITYLGDWHTHPASFPELSGRDKRTLRRIARYKLARVEKPLMLLLSDKGCWDVLLWQGNLKKTSLWNKQLSITKLEITLFE